MTYAFVFTCSPCVSVCLSLCPHVPYFHFFKFILFFIFLLFRAAPMAHGGSQARGPIRAVATSLCHSHSNARSEPRLQPTPQLMATPRILNPLSEARDRTCNLMVPRRIRFCWAMMGTPQTVISCSPPINGKSEFIYRKDIFIPTNAICFSKVVFCH